MRSKEARICVFCDRQRERESLNEKERKKERRNAFRFVSFDSAWIFRGINDNIFLYDTKESLLLYTFEPFTFLRNNFDSTTREGRSLDGKFYATLANSIVSVLGSDRRMVA